MKRLILGTATVLCILFAASLLPASAKDKWTIVRTKNFELVGNASDKEIRKVATRLEQFRDVFTRLLKSTKFSSSTPTTVVVFKDFDSYRKFGPPNSSGYFQGGQDKNYIALSAANDEANNPFTIIFHEFVHLLVKNNVQNMPLWFNEGLAEYYSTFEIKEGDRKVWLGKVISHHVYTLRARPLVPLKTLFAVDHTSPLYNEREKQSVFYAESWALVHYMLLNPERNLQLGKFLRLILSGQSADKAFPVAFGADYSVIEKELKEYVKRDSYPSQTATFEHKLEFDLEMKSTLLSEAEGEFYLGDLLSHSAQFDRAEKHLQKAIALDPSLAVAYASLGMLEMYRGKFAEAERNLERAAAANTGNYVVHYYYAFVLSRAEVDAEDRVSTFSPALAQKLRAELKKAIELAPNFADSYRLLALVNIVSNEQLDESVVLMKRAMELVPGDQEYAFMLAQVYMRKGDYKAARERLSIIAESSSSPQELRQHSKSMLADIDSRDEWMTRQKAGPTGSSQEVVVVGPDEQGNRLTMEEMHAAAMEQAMPTPNEGELRVRGQLLRIECGNKSVTFNLQIGDRSLMLGSTNFEGIQFTSFVQGVSGEISCGARKPVDEVVVVYRTSKAAKAKVEGEVVSVTFVPKEFKFKP